MKTYKITKNGYLIGKAKGKNKAVQFVVGELNTYYTDWPKWNTANGRIVCLNGHDEYIISEDKGV